MLRMLPDKLLGIRDRALLLVGFAGAFRRSELVALDVADIQFTAEGLLITLRRSKSDQEGEGRQIAIPPGKPEGDMRCACGAGVARRILNQRRADLPPRGSRGRWKGSDWWLCRLQTAFDPGGGGGFDVSEVRSS
jgi:integrase